MGRVVVRPKAQRDIVGILAYYIDNVGDEVAHRFRQSATDTFRELAEFPLMGVRRKVRRAEFKEIRMWRVRGFESYLVFYMPRNDGVAIERVIHASQDYRRVLR